MYIFIAILNIKFCRSYFCPFFSWNKYVDIWKVRLHLFYQQVTGTRGDDRAVQELQQHVHSAIPEQVAVLLLVLMDDVCGHCKSATTRPASDGSTTHSTRDRPYCDMQNCVCCVGIMSLVMWFPKTEEGSTHGRI